MPLFCRFAMIALIAGMFSAHNTLADSPPAIFQNIQTVFVIAMENHNFTQSDPTSSPQQLFTNPAAPYLNSLITPGHTNAVHVSYCTHYFNAGIDVHPSEASYIWSEAGTDFGAHTDDDPAAEIGNLFDVDHLTRQLNTAGITWKNYQEDVQYSSSPVISAYGAGGAINPFYGTGEYDYAVKHNPMAFFSDTQSNNVYALTNLFRDLTNNSVGRYNWITPNQYNDMHSSLSDGFTYHGISYTGDQAAIAQGDNFLSIIIPRIMASPAYQNNGAIILWWDESEDGDSTNEAIPEIIISPLAKGNAYASHLEYSHSSDLRTMEEIFGLGFLTNPIPAAETRVSGTGYNAVTNVNDLSDLFIAVLDQVSGSWLTNNGGFRLSFNAGLGQPYRVLGSDDAARPVTNWTVYASGIVTNVPVLFIDATATANPQRFFRVASP